MFKQQHTKNNVKSKVKETKGRIIRIFKKTHREQLLSKREIARLLKISPASASKYVDIMAAQGLLEVKDYGNINLVGLKKER